MTDHKLISAEEAQALLKDATPGPWMVSEEDFGNTFEVLGQDRAGRFGLFPIIDTGDPSDAPLIAAAPDLAHTVIAQAEQIERLQEAYSYAEKHLEAIAIGTMDRLDAITASEWIRGHAITPQDMEAPK